MRHPDLRQRLLRAAEQEILSQGLGAVSLRGIARRVGVSHQATAHHFDDRAGLFTALAIEGFLRLTSLSREAGEAVPRPGAERVSAVAGAYLEFARHHPTLFDVMFRPELLKATDEKLLRARRDHLALLQETITSAQAHGWGPDLPADQLATLGWATVHGLAVFERDGPHAAAPGHPSPPRVDGPELSQLLTRVAHALGPTPPGPHDSERDVATSPVDAG